MRNKKNFLTFRSNDFLVSISKHHFCPFRAKCSSNRPNRLTQYCIQFKKRFVPGISISFKYDFTLPCKFNTQRILRPGYTRRQVAATSLRQVAPCILLAKQVAATRRQCGAHAAISYEGECELVFYFDMAGHMTLSHWFVCILPRICIQRAKRRRNSWKFVRV